MNELFENDISPLWKLAVVIHLLCAFLNFGTFCSNDDCSNWEIFSIEAFIISAVYINYINYNLLDKHNAIY